MVLKIRLRHVKVCVNIAAVHVGKEADAPARSEVVTCSKSNLIARCTHSRRHQCHCRGSSEHLAFSRPTTASVPDCTAEQQTQVRLQLCTSLAPPGSRTVWSSASSTRASTGGTRPSTVRSHRAWSHATAGCTTGQYRKTCGKGFSCPFPKPSPAHCTAEQHTASLSSCSPAPGDCCCPTMPRSHAAGASQSA